MDIPVKTKKVLKAAAISALLLAGSRGVVPAQDRADTDLHQDHRMVSGVPYDGFLKGALIQTDFNVVEEVLVYDISFLIFRNAAVATLTMKYLPERRLYEGVVSAQTRGFIRFVSLSRRDTYRSLMRLSPRGRLIPVEFRKEVRIGSSRKTSTTVLDYDAGVMRWKSTEADGDEAEVKSHPIPAGVIYEDFISAFFNLRRGVYGPVKPGKEFRILSIPTRKWFKERQKKLQYFTVKVGERRIDENGIPSLEVALTVPKELFGQKVGDLQFHIGEDNVPLRIVVRKAVLFGDMKGKLRSRRTIERNFAAQAMSEE